MSLFGVLVYEMCLCQGYYVSSFSLYVDMSISNECYHTDPFKSIPNINYPVALLAGETMQQHLTTPLYRLRRYRKKYNYLRNNLATTLI